MGDRTNWRNMLKNEVEDIDLYEIFQALWPQVKAELEEAVLADAEVVADADAVIDLQYPALAYPTKVSSFNT